MKECGPAAAHRIICVDAHPFALAPGATSGSRIFQLGNWGALARYPKGSKPVKVREKLTPLDGPVLLVGQVYTAEQRRLGLSDVWHTQGYDHWIIDRCLKLELYKFRKHPRIWMVENPGEKQPSLAEDLEGCSRVETWNSTVGIHARMMGYHTEAAEHHGWARMELEHLAALEETPEALRSGDAWARYRSWLLS